MKHLHKLRIQVLLQIRQIVGGQIVLTQRGRGRFGHGVDPIGATAVIFTGIDLVPQGCSDGSTDAFGNGRQDLFGLKDQAIVRKGV